MPNPRSSSTATCTPPNGAAGSQLALRAPPPRRFRHRPSASPGCSRAAPSTSCRASPPTASGDPGAGAVSSARCPPVSPGRSGRRIPRDLDGDGRSSWLRGPTGRGRYATDRRLLVPRPRRGRQRVLARAAGQIADYDGVTHRRPARRRAARSGVELPRRPARQPARADRRTVSDLRAGGRRQSRRFAARPSIVAHVTCHTFGGLVLTPPVNLVEHLPDGDRRTYETRPGKAAELTGYRAMSYLDLRSKENELSAERLRLALRPARHPSPSSPGSGIRCAPPASRWQGPPPRPGCGDSIRSPTKSLSCAGATASSRRRLRAVAQVPSSAAGRGRDRRLRPGAQFTTSRSTASARRWRRTAVADLSRAHHTAAGDPRALGQKRSGPSSGGFGSWPRIRASLPTNGRRRRSTSR